MNFFCIAVSATLVLMQVSCNSQHARTDTTKTSPSQPDNQSPNQLQTPPYELHGILDAGLNNIVAFAIQTPLNWQVQQSFTRAWNRSAPVNQIYIKLISPGNKTTIEFFPLSTYFYTDGPMSHSMRQMTTSSEATSTPSPGEMKPMQPIDYITRIILPQLAQRGLHFTVSGSRSMPGVTHTPNVSTHTGYVDGASGSGTRVRVDCVINMTTTQVNNETYYNWEAYPSVTQTNGNLDVAYGVVIHGRKSVIFNPDWTHQNQQLVTNGNIENNGVDRRNVIINKDYRAHADRIIGETYGGKIKSSNRRQDVSGDGLIGQRKNENTQTRDRVKLSHMYNHVYRDGQGNYYGSTAQVDASQFDWKGLQRVELMDY